MRDNSQVREIGMKVLLATNNGKKLKELKEILGKDFDVLCLKDIGISIDVVEDAGSFAGNAMKKAVEAGAIARMLTLADDSGLCVDALGGRPGVFSARYAGPEKDDRKNNLKLLEDLKCQDVRSAKFVSVVCIADTTGVLGLFRGELAGTITYSMAGDNGFGYDPVFVPVGHKKTFACMSASEKNNISHRKRALSLAKAFLKRYSL